MTRRAEREFLFGIGRIVFPQPGYLDHLPKFASGSAPRSASCWDDPYSVSNQFRICKVATPRTRHFSHTDTIASNFV